MAVHFYLILTVFLVSLLIHRRFKRMRILKDSSVEGPVPNYFSGNINDYERTPNVLWDEELIKKYGPICGYYLGAKPVILISHLETALKIMWDPNFVERPRRVPGGINPDPLRAHMLANLPVPQWAKMRKILSPSFNKSSLLKQNVADLINRHVDVFLSKISVGKEEDFYKLFQPLALDIIASTAFGSETNIQNNPKDPLIDAVAGEFSKSTSSTFVKLLLCYPEFSFFLNRIRLFKFWLRDKFGIGAQKISEIWRRSKNALNERRENIENYKKKRDLLQKLNSSNLSNEEIVANMGVIFEASFETISSGLGFILHLLIKYQDVQERVWEEINGHLDKYGKFDHRVNELKYLSAVISESLRIFPPQTTFIGRAPSNDTEFDINGRVFKIPKGMQVQIALSQICASGEAFENPAQFKPERFLSPEGENLQLKNFLSFGVGRRSCIGKDFAFLVIKLLLCKLLAKYKVEKGAHFEMKPEILYKTATMTPKNGSWAIAFERA